MLRNKMYRTKNALKTFEFFAFATRSSAITLAATCFVIAYVYGFADPCYILVSAFPTLLFGTVLLPSIPSDLWWML